MSTRLMVRMTAPTLAISGLLLALGVVGAWYVQRMQRNVSENLLWNVDSMRAAEELEIALRDVYAQLDRFLLTRRRLDLDQVSRLKRETDRWLGRAQKLAVTPREKELIAQAGNGYGCFYGAFDRLTRQPFAQLPPRVQQLKEVLTRQVLRPVHEYLDFNETEVETTAAENQDLAEWLVLGLLLLGTCGAGAGLLAGFGFARGLHRSIIQLSVPIRDAAGKLNEVVGPVTLSAGWGLQELGGTLRKMAHHIGTVIDRLQKSQREVLRAEQLAAVGQLAAGMAHELRNPLMSMKILVQAAGESTDAAGLHGRDLAVLEEEITRLERLIQSFLDFARPPALKKQLLEVHKLVEPTLGLVSGRAGRQGVSLRWHPPRRPVRIEADMGQIRQVLLNLLFNALDVLPRGGAVRIVTRKGRPVRGRPAAEAGDRFPAAGGWLTLRVADNGPGLPAGLGQQIFEPFVSTKETGVGLGLSICRRIVEAHGGDIRAANGPTGGAIFTIRLPLPPGESARPAGPAQDAVCPAGAGS